jgi:hypothetical protein
MLYEPVSDISRDALRVARVLKQAGYSIEASPLI